MVDSPADIECGEGDKHEYLDTPNTCEKSNCKNEKYCCGKYEQVVKQMSMPDLLSNVFE
jgi:hypothetical protein